MLLLVLLLSFSPRLLGQQLRDPAADPGDSAAQREPRRDARQLKSVQETKPHIQELSIKTTVVSRYASTAVYCAMLNRHTAATDASFHFPVPAGAYISNFTMIIGGRVYQSEVRPKEKGDKPGEGKPKNREWSDTSSRPEAEVFRMTASVPGRNRAVFLLMYEELLQRRQGRYELVTSLRPLQLVSRLSLDVTVADHASIVHLEVLPLRSNKIPAKANVPVATAVMNEHNVWKVNFSPNIVQQAKISISGILGDFVIRYDVQRDSGIGDIQVSNGHFVHYFAPKDLPAVPKSVVFVMDSSASMLGKKMRQTKDALLTIVGDLRPADHFNFISFSNKIKVWQPNRLVPVTPLNVRDAKKFIHSLIPNGGTNIDGAIQAGSALLRDHPSDPNSVSLIILLMDGRPKIGETRSTILGNTRSAVQERFCIFTIGIGNDVDYQLLERMALENCGMMRRIGEDADASAMLRGFYTEIGTPLLSDVRIDYTGNSVVNVTQNVFTNYFNGSEIVVAGKLAHQGAGSLRVQVTASSDDRIITMETDVPLRRLQAEPEENAEAKVLGSGVMQGWGNSLGSAVEDFAERVWAFMSLKDELRARLRSQTSRDRDAHVQRATNLSLNYHLLSPLTYMVVEKPEVLAAGTMATAAAIRPPSDELPAEGETRGQASPLSHRTEKAERRSVRKSVTVSRTSADGDPHFVVEFPLSKLTACFNVNGEPGDVLRLVSDHESSGVTVNGRLIGAPPPPGSHKQQRTYFSSITVVADRPRRAYIEVTPKKVIVDGRDRIVLPCHTTAAVDGDALSVAISAGSNVTVTVGGNISFVILLHQYRNPAPYQRDHLGFYVGDGAGLSWRCHGLLGQFLHQEVGLAQLPAPGGGNGAAFLKVKGRSVPVVQKSRRIYGGTQNVDCWFARNNGEKLLDGRYGDYVASHMFDTRELHGKNGA